jgi:hypothetical protein
VEVLAASPFSHLLPPVNRLFSAECFLSVDHASDPAGSRPVKWWRFRSAILAPHAI